MCLKPKKNSNLTAPRLCKKNTSPTSASSIWTNRSRIPYTFPFVDSRKSRGGNLVWARLSRNSDFSEAAAGAACRAFDMERARGAKGGHSALLRIDGNQQQPPTFHSIRTRSMSLFDLYFILYLSLASDACLAGITCPTYGQMADFCGDKSGKGRVWPSENWSEGSVILRTGMYDRNGCSFKNSWDRSIYLSLSLFSLISCKDEIFVFC